MPAADNAPPWETQSLIPTFMLSNMRADYAVRNGFSKRLMLRTWGGLGDQICAEPTLRYAVETFTDCEISLASDHHELFAHLKFKEVFDTKRVHPVLDRHLLFDTIVPPQHLFWQFVNHMNTHCVDFASICAFRCQLPTARREVKLSPTETDIVTVSEMFEKNQAIMPVAIHPGRHWQSKTFPKDWWDAVISTLLSARITPVLIGNDTDDNRGTVDVDVPEGVLDLRGKLSIMESVALVQNVRVLLTNDSAPLHMAASGNAWIGYVPTVKHPDHITHWRNGKWGWRMRAFGNGGVWDEWSLLPNVNATQSVENVGDEKLRSWLPSPKEFALWALSCERTW